MSLDAAREGNAGHVCVCAGVLEVKQTRSLLVEVDLDEGLAQIKLVLNEGKIRKCTLRSGLWKRKDSAEESLERTSLFIIIHLSVQQYIFQYG